MAKKTTVVKKEKPDNKKNDRDISRYYGEIQKRAYEIYEFRIRNGMDGDAVSDWTTAENEIKVKYHI